jgi:hypothetical protein
MAGGQLKHLGVLAHTTPHMLRCNMKHGPKVSEFRVFYEQGFYASFFPIDGPGDRSGRMRQKKAVNRGNTT